MAYSKVALLSNNCFSFQNNSFPERNTIYDFCFEKKASGSWVDWMDTLDKSSLTIPGNAKVWCT